MSVAGVAAFAPAASGRLRDTRNSQVFRLIAELQAAGCDVDVYDPWVTPGHGHGVHLVETPEPVTYDAVIGAVAHRQFTELPQAMVRALGKRVCVFYDIRNVFEGVASRVCL